MMKLIAFVDGSNYSKSVCDHTAWIAGRIDATVDLIHILGRRWDQGIIGYYVQSTLNLWFNVYFELYFVCMLHTHTLIH